ncbi:MAP/microtubule affinity-regulating kinase 3 [Sciurus carolinensis]|uniref:non-specific serine/threonine protein kinase n=1 Tax=Sciurus carolinensis TaxID=30640 RepID=A0AA41T6V8_SCICA|nr:MAP/microtubule affinity-regulating kinase 3 [Sciurus carolinensis]
MCSESSQSSVALQGQSSCCEATLTDHYTVMQGIREGGFAQVKLACHLHTGTEVEVSHGKGVVHFDLKSENVMVDASNNIKLINFGLSTRFTTGKKLKRFSGTVPYLAPEVIHGKEYEGPPADVWSLRVILCYAHREMPI